MIAGGALLALLASCSDLPQAPSQAIGPQPMDTSIGIFVDLASFEAAARRLDSIDFEDQPVDGSSNCPPTPGPTCTPIPNPLTLEGVVFTDPGALHTGFCSSPTCVPDPDNPHGGNISISLDPGGIIDFPAYTGGALLVIEGIGDNPFQIRATDGLGGTRIIDGTGVSFGVAYAGFGSPAGITRIEVLSVGGTGGPLGISAVIFSRRLPI
jgi:hypothetical protein